MKRSSPFCEARYLIEAADGTKAPSMARYKQMAQQREAFWKLVMSGVFTYTEVSLMDFDDFYEARAALELFGSKVSKLPTFKPRRRPRRRW